MVRGFVNGINIIGMDNLENWKKGMDEFDRKMFEKLTGKTPEQKLEDLNYQNMQMEEELRYSKQLIEVLREQKRFVWRAVLKLGTLGFILYALMFVGMFLMMKYGR